MTSRVDFYVLDSSAVKQRWLFACRLVEKAYLNDLRVVILADPAAVSYTHLMRRSRGSWRRRGCAPTIAPGECPSARNTPNN